MMGLSNVNNYMRLKNFLGVSFVFCINIILLVTEGPLPSEQRRSIMQQILIVLFFRSLLFSVSALLAFTGLLCQLEAANCLAELLWSLLPLRTSGLRSVRRRRTVHAYMEMGKAH